MSQAPKWVLKVRSKQLKHTSFPKIGHYSDYPNIDDVPYNSCKLKTSRLKDSFSNDNESTKETTTSNHSWLESYLNSSGSKEPNMLDPIHAFDLFQLQSKQASPISSSSLIRLGNLLQYSNLLSLTGKRNRIQLLLDRLEQQENWLTFPVINLVGFLRRNSFVDLEKVCSYLDLFNGEPTKEALEHVILGLCENSKPLDAYEIWLGSRYEGKFQNTQTNSLERSGLLMKIFDSLAKLGRFKELVNLTQDIPMMQQFNLYIIVLLADHMCKARNFSSSSLDELLGVFFIDTLKREYCKNRQISLRVWFSLFKLSKIRLTDRFSSSLLSFAKEVGADVDFVHTVVNADLLLGEGKVREAHELCKGIFKINEIAESSNECYWILNKMIVSMCSVVLNNYSNKKLVGDTLCLLYIYYVRLRNSKRHINDKTLKCILEAFASVGNHQRCKSVLQTMKNRRLHISADHYFYLIAAYCRCGSVLLANEVLQEMKQMKIKPNVKSFHIIILSYLSQTKPNYVKAFSYWRQMHLLKLDIPSILYQETIEHFMSTKDLRNARKWMEVLQESDAFPPVNVFNMLMNLALESRQFKLVKHYHTAIQLTSMSPNKQSRLLLFKTYCRSLDEDRALVFWNAHSDELADDDDALLSFLNMIFQSSRDNAYTSVFDYLDTKLSSAQYREGDASLDVYHVFLSCLIKNNCLELVDRFLCNNLAPKKTVLHAKTVDFVSKIAHQQLSQIANQYLMTLKVAFTQRQSFIGTVAQVDSRLLHELIVRRMNVKKKRERTMRRRSRASKR